MSRSVLFYIIGLVIFQLSTCVEKPFTHKLVITDRNNNYRLIENVSLPVLENGQIPKEEFDSTHNIGIFRYDSLLQKEYLIRITTLFNDVKTFSFYLDKDTTICIHDEPCYQMVQLIPKNSLQHYDTLMLAYVLDGCFSHEVNIYYFTRRGNDFIVSRSLNPDSCRYGPHLQRDTLIHGILNLQQVVTSHHVRQCYSTVCQTFYLKAGNNVFCSGDLDDTLLKQYHQLVDVFF